MCSFWSWAHPECRQFWLSVRYWVADGLRIAVPQWRNDADCLPRQRACWRCTWSQSSLFQPIPPLSLRSSPHFCPLSSPKKRAPSAAVLAGSCPNSAPCVDPSTITKVKPDKISINKFKFKRCPKIRTRSKKQRFRWVINATSCGTLQNQAIPMIFASTIADMQIHDRQIARGTKVHGPAPRNGLPAPGCRNRTALPVPRGVQDEVAYMWRRFRENERVQLDRHSYEVQIKELTEKLSEEHLSRTEIDKLKEFIRRQSVSLPRCR